MSVTDTHGKSGTGLTERERIMGRKKATVAVKDRDYVWRRPFAETQGDVTRWWVRRREKVSGKVVRILLDAMDEDTAVLEVQDRAAEERRRLKAEGHKAGTPIVPVELSTTTLTVRAALTKFLSTKEGEVRSETLAGYKRDCEKYAKALGATRLLASITPEDVRDALTKRWGADLRGRTLRKHRFFLCEMFTYFRDELQVIVQNPAQRMKEPSRWKDEENLGLEETGRAFTDEELEKLVVAAEGEMRLFVILAAQTGLRKSNLIGGDFKTGLRWSEVPDWNKPGKERLSIDAKKMKWNRSHKVPLHPECGEALREHARGRTSTDEDAPVFNMSRRDLRDGWESLQRKAGVEPRRIHDLRGSACNRWERKCSVGICYALEHHSTTGNVRLQSYVKPPDEEIRAALANVPRLVPTEEEKREKKKA